MAKKVNIRDLPRIGNLKQKMTLKWISVDLIMPPEPGDGIVPAHDKGTFQRLLADIRPHHAERIGEEFDHGKLDVLRGYMDSNGFFRCSDGLNRAHGARLRGVTELPCVVVKPGDINEAIDWFVDKDRNHIGLTRYDKLYAESFCTDTRGTRSGNIHHAVKVSGFHLTGDKKAKGPDTITSTEGVEAVYDEATRRGLDGIRVLTETLSTIRSAWPDHKMATNQNVVRAVAHLLEHYPVTSAELHAINLDAGYMGLVAKNQLGGGQDQRIKAIGQMLRSDLPKMRKRQKARF